jgi:hypothetical protein
MRSRKSKTYKRLNNSIINSANIRLYDGTCRFILLSFVKINSLNDLLLSVQVLQYFLLQHVKIKTMLKPLKKYIVSHYYYDC